MRHIKLYLLCILALSINFSYSSEIKAFKTFAELNKAVERCIETQDQAFEKSLYIINLNLPQLKAQDKQKALILRAYCYSSYLLRERYYNDPSIIDSFYLVTNDLFSAFGKTYSMNLKKNKVGSTEIEKAFEIISSIPSSATNLVDSIYSSFGSAFDAAMLLSQQITSISPIYKPLVFEKSFEIGYKNGDLNIDSYTDSILSIINICDQDSQKSRLWYSIANSFANIYPNKAYKYAYNSYIADSLSKSGKEAFKLMDKLSEPNFYINGKNLYSHKQACLFSIRAKNLKSVNYSLFRIPNEHKADMLLGMYQSKNYTKDAKAILKGVWKFDSLPQDFDYHCTELYLPALESGMYLLVLNDKTNFVFQVSKLSFANMGDAGFVINIDNGKPEKNIKVNSFAVIYNYKTHLNDYSFIAESISDKDGYVVIPQNDEFKDENKIILFSGSDSLLMQDSRYYPYYRNNNSKEDTTYRIHYLCNLPIYRPGDSVSIRGIICAFANINSSGSQSKFFPSTYSIKISLKPANRLNNSNQEFKSFTVITDSMGGFSLNFRLPDDAIGGDWQLISKGQTFSFPVESYRPPLFKIELQNNDSVVTGLAIGFTGIPLFNASVKVEVDIYGLNKRWTNTLQTDSIGRFSINISNFYYLEKQLPDNIRLNRNSYSITCTVTDLGGEMQEAQISIPLRKDPMYSHLITPSSDTGDFKIETKDGVWKKINTKYILKVYDIKDTLKDLNFARRWEDPDFYTISLDTFLNLFPLEPYYSKEYKEKSAIKNLIYEKELVNDSFRLNLKPDSYFYELFTFNPNNKGFDSIEGVFSIGRKPNIPTLYTHSALDSIGFVFINPLYNNLDLNAKSDSIYVFYTLEGRNGTVYKGIFKTLGERSEKTIYLSDFSKEEDIKCTWFYVYAQRLFSDIIYIESIPRTKPIELSIDSSYSPLEAGSKQVLKIKTTRNGKGISIPLTISLYDESLHEFTSQKWFWSQNPELFPIASPKPFSLNLGAYDFIWSTQRSNFYNSSATLGLTHMEQNSRGIRSFGAKSTDVLASDAPITETATREGTESKETTGNINADIFRKRQTSVFFQACIFSDSNGELSLPYIGPSNPGQYLLSVFGYDKSFGSAYKTQSLHSLKSFMLFYQSPRFLYVGDSLLPLCKAVRLDYSKAENSTVIWNINDNIHTTTIKWNAAEREKSVIAPIYVYIEEANSTTENLKIGIQIISQNGSKDGIEEKIPILKNRIKVRESISFCLSAGEKISIPLPKIYKHINDSNIYFSAFPEKSIEELCNKLYLDTSDNAYDALLHLLKNGLSGKELTLHSKKLFSYLTPENAFCWIKGQPSDFLMTLNIAQSLAENNHPQIKRTIDFVLSTKILPYLYKEIIKTHSQRQDSIPNIDELKYFYIRALSNKKPSSLSEQELQNKTLLLFAQNYSMYPIKTGVYGLYALYLLGQDKLFDQVWSHYKLLSISDKESGMYWKKENMGSSLGERLHTASLLYRLLIDNKHLAEAANINRWIWKQNRTVDIIASSSGVKALDILRIGYNQLLYPMPIDYPIQNPSIKINKNRLEVDWSNTNKNISDSIKNLYLGYGSISLQQDLYIKSITDNSSKSDLSISSSLVEQTKLGESNILRIEISAKRAFSYVQVRINRPGGTDFGLANSGNKYRNGLSFYQDVKDQYIDLFIPFIEVGRYTLQIPLNAQNPGSFAMPPCTIKSLFNESDSFSGYSSSKHLNISK